MFDLAAMPREQLENMAILGIGVLSILLLVALGLLLAIGWSYGQDLYDYLKARRKKG